MSILKRLLTVDFNYTDPLDRQRAHGLLWVNWVAVLAWVILVGVLQRFFVYNLEVALHLQSLILIFAPPVIFYRVYQNVQQGSLKSASRQMVLLAFLVAIPMEITPVTLVVMTLPIVVSGVLLQRNSIVYTMVAEIVVLALALALRVEIVSEIDAAAVASIVLVLIADAVFLYAFSTTSREFVTGTLLSVEEVKRAKRFSEQVSTGADEEAILTRLIEVVRDEMKYGYAQAYLLDHEGNLTRYIRTGLGVKIVGVAQQVGLNDANIVSRAARARTSLTATLKDNELLRGQFLPGATAGAAIPIDYQNLVVGVLDVQSETRTNFAPADLAALELLAGQAATLIVQARNQAVLQDEIVEQQAAAQHLRERLRELQPSKRESLWNAQLIGEQNLILGFDLTAKDKSPVPANDVPDSLRPALETGEVFVETTEQEKVINVPIILHDEVLGAMSFAIGGEQVVSERQLEMLKAVSTRLALSLEARHLYEQSQAQAMRESKAGEVASLLISATDVRTVLNMAAESFNETLGAVNTRIFLKPGFLRAEAQREEV